MVEVIQQSDQNSVAQAEQSKITTAGFHKNEYLVHERILSFMQRCIKRGRDMVNYRRLFDRAKTSLQRERGQSD